MGIFKNYFDIGKNSIADDFFKELQKPKEYVLKTRQKNDELFAGALQAFREGRPENIQTALLKAGSVADYNYPNLVPEVLLQVADGSSNKVADIVRAIEKIPAFRRKVFLSNALNNAIARGTGDEPFFCLLLKAGAEANADVNGPSGILATAICSAAPLSFIKVLHDSGASFDDALATLHGRGSKTEDVDRLEHYRKRIAAEPAKAERCIPGMEEAMIKVLETMQQMQEQIKDLTETVDRLSKATPAANTNQPKKPAPPRKGPFPGF